MLRNTQEGEGEREREGGRMKAIISHNSLSTARRFEAVLREQRRASAFP